MRACIRKEISQRSNRRSSRVFANRSGETVSRAISEQDSKSVPFRHLINIAQILPSSGYYKYGYSINVSDCERGRSYDEHVPVFHCLSPLEEIIFSERREILACG